MKLRKIGQTTRVRDLFEKRRAIARVKHLIEIFALIDIASLIQEVRDAYQEAITGPESRVVNGKTLWSQFETAADSYLMSKATRDHQLMERINEIAVASVLLADKALAGRTIQYEPNLLSDKRKIDFVVDRGDDNLYVEVKTVSPTSRDSEKAWTDYLRRKEHHPETLDYMITREGMGGKIYANEFKSRAHFLDYTLGFEKRLAAAKKIKAGPGVLVFCGNGFEWRKLQLENFSDFYRNKTPRADDPFGKMQQDPYKEEKY
jgi:hypothetical protein